MTAAFPDCMAGSGSAPSLVVTRLPDRDDEFVLWDALAAECELVVTWNLKHFPNAVLQPLNLEVLTPDAFLTKVLEANTTPTLSLLDEWLTQRHRPAYTRSSLILRLHEVQLTGFAETLKKHWPARDSP